MSKACYTDFGKKLVCDIVWVLLGLVLTADFKFFLLFENKLKNYILWYCLNPCSNG